MTVAIVSSIMFCYRLLVTFFPILPGYVPATREQLAGLRDERARTVSPRLTWVIRASAIAVLFGFVLTYFLVHRSAVEASQRIVAEVQRVIAAEPVHVETPSGVYPLRPERYRRVYLLANPMLNAASDDYEPVPLRSPHPRRVDGGRLRRLPPPLLLGRGRPGRRGHRRVPRVHRGRHRRPLCQLSREDGDNPPQSCARCHGLPNEADAPARLGLKGAYHRQCINCHERHDATHPGAHRVQLLPPSVDSRPPPPGPTARSGLPRTET